MTKKQAPESTSDHKAFTLSIAAAVLALVACGIAVFGMLSGGSSINAAFVRSGELVYKFKGMQEAQAVYNDKVQVWQANIDTLKGEFQRAVEQYQKEAPGLSATQRQTREQELMRQEGQLRQYTQTIQNQVRQEDEGLTGGVLKQINSFVEEYGKDHNYDIIFGTTNDGSILYGQDVLDITQEVLQSLNEAFDNGTLPAPPPDTSAQE